MGIGYVANGRIGQIYGVLRQVLWKRLCIVIVLTG